MSTFKKPSEYTVKERVALALTKEFTPNELDHLDSALAILDKNAIDKWISDVMELTYTIERCHGKVPQSINSGAHCHENNER